MPGQFPCPASAPPASGTPAPTPAPTEQAKATSTVATSPPSAPRTEVAEEGELVAAHQWAPQAGVGIAPPPPSSRTVAEGPAWAPVAPGELLPLDPMRETPADALPTPVLARATAGLAPGEAGEVSATPLTPECTPPMQASPLMPMASPLPWPSTTPLAMPMATPAPDGARTAHTPPMQGPPSGGAARAAVRALIVLGLACAIAIGAIGVSESGIFEGGQTPDAASYAARARNAAMRGDWEQPPGENFIEITETALQRWPDDWTLAAVRREAVGSLLAESLAAMPSNPSAAIAKAQLARKIDPADPRARERVSELSQAGHGASVRDDVGPPEGSGASAATNPTMPDFDAE